MQQGCFDIISSLEEASLRKKYHNTVFILKIKQIKLMLDYITAKIADDGTFVYL